MLHNYALVPTDVCRVVGNHVLVVIHSEMPHGTFSRVKWSASYLENGMEILYGGTSKSLTSIVPQLFAIHFL